MRTWLSLQMDISSSRTQSKGWCPAGLSPVSTVLAGDLRMVPHVSDPLANPAGSSFKRHPESHHFSPVYYCPSGSVSSLALITIIVSELVLLFLGLPASQSLVSSRSPDMGPPPPLEPHL